MLHGGEGLEKTGPVLGDSRNLGLLEHHLGNKDLVRIAGAPPWQVAAMAPEPGKELPAEPDSLILVV